MNAFAVRCARSLKFSWSRCISTSTAVSQSESDLIEELKRKIAENHRILRKHSHGHLKARGLTSSNANLKIAMQSVQRKIDNNANTIANIPSHVSIEVLANGSGHLRPCVVIRTPLKTYMFNCPEGASRFLPQLRLKALNITDIFVTRANWDNIAGISSVLLSKEANAMVTRLHGAVNIKHFLECIRPFQDSDYGSDKYPSQVEEYPFCAGSYEDAGLKVTYIPISPPFGESTSRSTVDIAYYVELKEPARRIDPRKIIAMKVPKGPLIGKLKNGETVSLPDGRVINPEDVFAEEEVRTNERKRALFVDCATEAHLQSLKENSLYNKLVSAENMDYVVHFSPSEVISLPSYSEMVKAFGSQCKHISVNERTPFVPGIESIYRNHHLLNKACDAVFPPLHPLGWSGLMTQGTELQKEEGEFVLPAPMQRFWMRQGGGEEPILADLRYTDAEITEEAEKSMSALKEDSSKLENTCEFPRVSFLGTSSAVPSKYRNVTGYLLEASESCAMMVDVGEGSYGQMKILLGKEGLDEMLLKLRCVLITHAHQDHMNGLFTIIQKRRDAFRKSGKEYVPMVLVCNRNILKPLKTYSMCFEDVESLVSIVDISRHPITPPPSPGAPPNKRRRLPSPTMSPTRDVLEMMPSLFSQEAWNIQEIKAVQVHHTRMANGFVIRANGKRLVFSGDTKPCDLLVEEGKDADLLIHEATFEDGHEKDAQRKKHSTMGQAVDIGRRMNAKNIILTHFSARYPKVPALPTYLDECGNVSVAMDNMSVRFDRLPLLPKLIPIYRELYREELFEIELRKAQRSLKEKNNEETPKNAVKVG